MCQMYIVCTYRWAFADVSMFGVARDCTGSTIFAWFILTAVKHSVTALAYKHANHTKKI